jgi:hypothetical protein
LDLKDTIKRTNIRFVGAPERKKEKGKSLKEIMAENSPNLGSLWTFSYLVLTNSQTH